MRYPLGPEKPETLEQRIRALEHDGNEYVPAIAPLGDDPGHCIVCQEVHKMREHELYWVQRRARCKHMFYTEVTAFNDPGRRFLCADCGAEVDDRP